jgi:hypothetical protein
LPVPRSLGSPEEESDDLAIELDAPTKDKDEDDLLLWDEEDDK